MGIGRSYLRIALGGAGVMGCIMLCHLFLTSSLPGSEFARALYQLPAGPPKKGTLWPMLDLFPPIIAMSGIIGYAFSVDRPWRNKLINVVIASLASALLFVAVLPLYTHLHLFPPRLALPDPIPIWLVLTEWYASTAIILVGGSMGTWIARLKVKIERKTGEDQAEEENEPGKWANGSGT
jgi:hypothetical protein